MSKSGIVNVRMVITEEKILLNIEKVQKMINPKSKKQIIELDDDAYFKDLIESIKTYLIEYPKKKNFPSAVYKAAYGLVEYATNQFEENTKSIEDLIRQREENITAANKLKEIVEKVANKEDSWKASIKEADNDFSEDIVDTLEILGKCKSEESEDYQDALKLLNARIGNLESNLHIEIDMERIEDRSKALSYIGIEIADALKTIPAPIEVLTSSTEEVKEEIVEEVKVEAPVAVNTIETIEEVEEAPFLTLENAEMIEENQEQVQAEQQQYIEETTFEAKPSLWQRIRQAKIVRALTYMFKAKIVLQYPALPEGNEDK